MQKSWSQMLSTALDEKIKTNSQQWDLVVSLADCPSVNRTELLSVLNSINSLSFEQLESALANISVDAAESASSLIAEGNLVFYMLRHQSPTEAKGGFRSSFDHGEGRWPLKEFAYSVIGHESISPKHAFLWFKRVPDRLRIPFIYFSKQDRNTQDVLNFFGRHLYRFELSKFKESALYAMGDITFNITRNREEGRPLYSGVFPARDRRALLLHYFMQNLKMLSSASTEVERSSLRFPFDEMIEIILSEAISPDEGEYLGSLTEPDKLLGLIPAVDLKR